MGGYIGAKTGTLVASASNIKGDISATDTTPEITLKNTTETDADGSRGGKITFKGEQSGGEESTLANIQASHDGTADDEKGDLIFRTNDGSDGASPTTAMVIDSSQNVAIGNAVPTGKLTISESSGANAPTSITADNTYLQLGSGDFGASNNGKFMIGFGFTDGTTNTNSPAYIGYQETSTSGDTKGALSFHTRDVITDTAPTEHMRIHTGGEITTPENPAFRVYATSTQQASSADQKVVWAGEELDRGGNFASNGFTAPVTGVYSFNVQFLSTSGQAQTTLYLKVGSSTVSYCRSSLTASNNHRTTNMNWIGTVTSGTEVCVYISGSGEYIYGDSSGDWTHFQGFLIG